MSAQGKIPCHCSGSSREQAACRDRKRCYNPEDGVNDISVLIDAITEQITDELFSTSLRSDGATLNIIAEDGNQIGKRNKGFTKRLVKKVISQYL